MKKKKTKFQRPSFFSALFHKPLLFLFVLFFLPFVVWGVQETQQVTSFGKNSAGLLRPLGNSYGSIDPIQGYPGGDPPAENHPDLNLAVRGHITTNGEKYPIVLGEAGDPKAPQISKILSSRPTIVSLYRIYSWDWANNKKGPAMPLPDDPAAGVKQVQMIGLATSPGEAVKVPPVYGNPISPEYNAMVLFADNNSITLKYTREDNIGIKNGYAIQIEEINVDPNLLSLYNQLNNSGRGNLPAVSNEQVIGTAKGNEIRVAIRDTGDFLDPRSKLDWWQGVDYPAVPTDIIQNPTATAVPQPTQTLPTATVPTAILPSPTAISNPLPTTNPANPNNPLPTRVQPTARIVSPVVSSPTPTPTSAPFFDIGKTVNLTRLAWNNFISNLEKFTKVILP